MKKLFLYISILFTFSCDGQIGPFIVVTGNPIAEEVVAGQNYFLRSHGQSNCEGITLVSTLPTTPVDLTREFQNVYIWHNATETNGGGAWEKLQAGVNNERETRLIYYGWEIYLAHLFETNHPNDKLYISKFGAGGSTVTDDGTGNNWNLTGGLYNIAMNYYDIPAAAAVPGGIDVDLGMLWVQGEDETQAGREGNTLTNSVFVLDRFRTALSASTMPILIPPINIRAYNNTASQTVRIHQSSKPGELCDLATYPYNNRFEFTDNYPTIDIVHYEQIPFGRDLYYYYFGWPTSFYSDELAYVIRYAQDSSITLPNSVKLAAIDSWISGLKTDGTWEISDAIWWGAYNDTGLGAFASLNLKHPGYHRMDYINSVDYGVSGWRGDASSAYVQTNFRIDVNPIHYLQNDATRAMWISEAHTSTNTFIDGTPTANINTIRAASSVGQRINQGSGNLAVAYNFAGIGYTAIGRSSSTDVEMWKSSTKTTGTGTSSALTNLTMTLFRSGSTYGNTRLAFYIMAGDLTDTQHQNLGTSSATCLTAMGL